MQACVLTSLQLLISAEHVGGTLSNCALHNMIKKKFLKILVSIHVYLILKCHNSSMIYFYQCSPHKVFFRKYFIIHPVILVVLALNVLCFLHHLILHQVDRWRPNLKLIFCLLASFLTFLWLILALIKE